MRVEGCVYVCGETEPTVKRDRKAVAYAVGLLYVFYTMFELTLKLTIHVIQNLVCNETLVTTKFKL